MKISKECEENGMIEAGYSDLVFVTEKEEIPSICLFICHSNERLKKIIKDPKAESKIVLPDHITKRSFLLLSCYYGYGVVDINEENVCDLLNCCICFNEGNLMNICLKYIKSHESKKLVVDVLNILNLIPKDYLNDLEMVLKDYIQINCCEILNDKNILNLLYLDDIKFIISIDNLLVPSEKYLLDKILEHYKSHVTNKSNMLMNKEEEEKRYNEAMKLLNWKEINIGEINVSDIEIINLNMMYKRKNESINRIYNEEPNTGNELLNKIIRRGLRELIVNDDDKDEEEVMQPQPQPQQQIQYHIQPPPEVHIPQQPQVVLSLFGNNLQLPPSQPLYEEKPDNCIDIFSDDENNIQQIQHPQVVLSLFGNNLQLPPSQPLYEEKPDNCIDIFSDDENNIQQIQHLDLLNILYEEIKRTKSGMEILVIFKLSKKIKLQLFEKLTLEDKIRIVQVIREEYCESNINVKIKYKIIEVFSYFSKSNNNLLILYYSNGSEIFVDLLNSKYIQNKNLLINFIRSNIPNPNSILEKQKN